MIAASGGVGRAGGLRARVPVFATGSKANPDPVLGRRGAAAMRPIRTAAGGEAASRAPLPSKLLAAGADSVAVIGDLFLKRARGKDCGPGRKNGYDY